MPPRWTPAGAQAARRLAADGLLEAGGATASGLTLAGRLVADAVVRALADA